MLNIEKESNSKSFKIKESLLSLKIYTKISGRCNSKWYFAFWGTSHSSPYTFLTLPHINIKHSSRNDLWSYPKKINGKRSSAIRQKDESQNGGNKANKACQIFWKTFLTPWVSGCKCSFFGKFDVLCFLVISVLRFALLPYYWQVKKSSKMERTKQLWYLFLHNTQLLWQRSYFWTRLVTCF